MDNARRIRRILEQRRSTQRYYPRRREDEDRPVVDMIELARETRGYEYRRVAALLTEADGQVGFGRVEPIRKQLGAEGAIDTTKEGKAAA